MNEARIVRCWCAPPNTGYLTATNFCTWPECVNRDKPDPAASPAEGDDG